MSNLELVVKDVDGVGFYTDANGRSGITQSGLAILCGVDKATIGRVIASISKKPPKGLEHLVNKVLECRIKIETGMWLCNDELCIAIIRYYDRKGNQKAQYTFDKFAGIGFNVWVQSITGWQAPSLIPAEVKERLEKLETTAMEAKQEAIEAKLEAKANSERIERLEREVAQQPKHPHKRKFFVKGKEEALQYYPEKYAEIGKVVDSDWYYIDLDLIEIYRQEQDDEQFWLELEKRSIAIAQEYDNSMSLEELMAQAHARQQQNASNPELLEKHYSILEEASKINSSELIPKKRSPYNLKNFYNKVGVLPKYLFN